ncbi:hypothetical protein GWK47_014716 [Chionoecetes opilio]|uniref:Transposase Tc1-like domain-containing protein n=1 Tax=Chionoecetes opilio TaxID=41210 RepID=A0A8J4XUH5_CHIOP|nr:hypothetical protein GWK47_014716 [Chionoecetes opilio]
MGRKPQLTSDQITLIYSLHKAGFRPKEIAEEAKVSLRSVTRLKKIHETTDNIPPTHLNRPGRSKAVPIKTLQIINCQLTNTPSCTARKIKETNQSLLQNVPVRTVSRYIQKDFNLLSRRAARKPFLTPRHKENLVAFAKEYVTWPLDKVRSILWSDESIFLFTLTAAPSKRVRRP